MRDVFYLVLVREVVKRNKWTYPCNVKLQELTVVKTGWRDLRWFHCGCNITLMTILKKNKKMRVVFMCATFYDTDSSLLLRIVKWNTFPIFTSLIFHGMIIRLFIQESHHSREQTRSSFKGQQLCNIVC